MEEKKSKWKKIIKIAIYSLLGLLIILIGFTACKKTNALTSYNNYGYQYIGTINDMLEYDNDNKEAYLSLQYSYHDGKWNQYTDDNYTLRHYIITIQNTLDYSDGLGISMASVQENNTYLFKGIRNSADETYQIYSITTITIYQNVLTSDIYNQGYETGMDANNQEAWEQGKQQGLNEATNNYNQTLDTITNQYNAGLQAKQDQIDTLQDLVDGNTTPWGSFKSLLGFIMTFPIQFFKEGLDVDIFGVNVGGLIVGVGILLVLLTIIGFIFGRGGKTHE